MTDKIALVRLRAANDNFDQGFTRSTRKVQALGAEIDALGGSRIQKFGASFESTFDRSLGKVGTSLTRNVTLPLAAVGAGAMFAAVSWESSWAGVLKTVDGTGEQLNQLESDLRGMAKELPASHREIAGVAEAAGQLGVAVGDVAEFTKVMVDLGETTNLTAEEAATSLARFSNIMGTSTSDVDRMGATIVELGNNSATTEREIVEMATRLAAAGKIAGLSEADVFAFASSLTSVGVEAEAGGTALSKVFTSMRDAVIDGGAELETFAQTAGMSAANFAQAFRDDPAKAITAFIEGMGRLSKSGQSTTAVFDQLQLTDQRLMRAVLSTGEAQGLLAGQIDMASSAWDDNTALSEEAEKRYATTAAQLEMLRNQVVDLGIGLGEYLLPVLGAGVDVLSALVAGFDMLPGPLQAAVVGFGVLVAAIGPAMKVTQYFIDNFKTLQKVLDKAATAAYDGAGAIDKYAGAATAATVIVAAAAVAVWAWSDAKANARKRTMEFVEAMEADNGAIGENTDALIRNKVAQADLNDNLIRAGITYDEFVNALKAGGDEGERVIGQLVDRGRLTGDETLKLGGLVNAYQDATKEMAESERAGMGIASASKASADAIGEAGNAAQVSAQQTQLLVAASQNLFESMFGMALSTAKTESAFTTFNKAMAGTSRSGGRAAKAVDVVAEKAKKVESASRDAERAMRSWESSVDDVADAQQRLVDAQAALDAALAGPTERERAEALNKQRRAELSLEDAKLRVAEAQEALTDAEAWQDPEETAAAKRNLTKAELDLESATWSSQDATKSYTDVAGFSAATDAKAKDARDAVTAAQKRLTDATRDSADRYRDLQTAQADQAAVQNASLASFGSANSALSGHRDKVNEARDAYLGLASSVSEAIGRILSMNITTSDKLGQLDLIIDQVMSNPYLNAGQKADLRRMALNTKQNLALSEVFPNYKPGGGRASGGSVQPGFEYTVGEYGRERLLMHPDGGGTVVPLTGSFSPAGQGAPRQSRDGTSGGLVIENASFGDRSVVRDLDFWARTRGAAV